MKILIVNVSGRLSTDGSRLISALLKRSGHTVTSVFFSRPAPLLYEREELGRLDEILKATDLVMISVYSSYAVRAIQLSDYIHERFPGMFVFWGGPHCVSVPEVGLRHADGVCFSEGDEAVVDLVDRIASGRDFRGTPNFAFMAGGTVTRNAVLPPFADLDSLPYFDFSGSGHFLLDGDLIPMSLERLKERLADFPFRLPTFYFMTSRGCPNSCSYCNNCRYVSLFGSSSIRLLSVDRVISELEHQLSALGFIQAVGFSDDDFFVRPLGQLEEFAAKYKKTIGLPFGVAISARTYSREKLDALMDAGLKVVQMGVQSASQRVLERVYNRKISVAKTREVTRALSGRQKKGLKLFLDFIIDNPYERKSDIMQTYGFIRDLEPGVKINIFYLAYFPGTPLFNRALADGIIGEHSQRASRPYTRSRLRYQKNWESFLILFARFLRRLVRRKKTALGALLWMLGTRPVRLIMSVLPGSVFATAGKIVQ
jgi:anaerobic magnesium-protoporphyrin IX monomethyl ester cyclase